MSAVENVKEQLLSSGSWFVGPAHSTIEFRFRRMVVQAVRGQFLDFDDLLVGDTVDLVLDVAAVRVG
jgi:polyisoprenoid-binding protein YceI